ncbi:GGDEF domain-containing protein [Paenibacillus sp. CF384]|uniref:GGDEF domain-containing protein n=1 Tax=Paenibacillus sp. CF384 TaxID=1884382 RepID=UPI000898BCCD|nr:GGDEF domain-containing protein [Paenibacillus sp. CF384]SDX16040.1 diguanylate cyclase (GGDEF) domain-containing protein [Paenibacillus sp. CF384]
MNEISYGLLDKTMLHRLQENWHQGGIGVIALQLLQGTPVSVVEVLDEWVMEQEGLIWHSTMGDDRFYFLACGLGASKELELRLQVGIDELKMKFCKAFEANRIANVKELDGKPDFAVGHAVSYPSAVNGRSIEASMYEAIKEAYGMVVRFRSGERDEQQEQEQQEQQQTQQQQETYFSNVPSYVTIGSLAKTVPIFAPGSLVSDLSRMFESNPHIQGAVVVQEGRPIGLVMKENMNQLLAGQFGLPLYWNRAIARIMDKEALVVDAELPVEQVVQLAMARDISRLYHLVLITRGDKFVGAASVRSILECMTQLRTEEARTANPLTGLPGNASIQREMQRRIDAGRPFTIIYADLDYFKWFNDCFGFSQGDALIRFLASVLQEVAQVGGKRDDFIGHIGGDDFIMLTDRLESEKLCRLLLARFDSGVRSYYGSAHVPSVVDRSGVAVQQEGVTLSLSLLSWNGTMPLTTAIISQAAARVKKQAKGIRGSAYVASDVFGEQLGEGMT